MIKQDLERDLRNNGNEILELLLHEHLYENDEMLHHLDELLLDDFRRFIEDMRSQVFNSYILLTTQMQPNFGVYFNTCQHHSKLEQNPMCTT
jgi:hypothetical protein